MQTTHRTAIYFGVGLFGSGDVAVRLFPIFQKKLQSALEDQVVERQVAVGKPSGCIADREIGRQALVDGLVVGPGVEGVG